MGWFRGAEHCGVCMDLCLGYRPLCAHRQAESLATAAVLISLLLPGSGAASERIKVEATSLDGSTTLRSLAGTMPRSAPTTWLLYPEACTDRANGTWAPKTSAVADSLNTYTPGTSGPYGREDQSLNEILGHVVDATTPSAQRPSILGGSRSLWCGKYEPSWAVPVGYPNNTYQILYLDTGSHGANYSLSFKHNFSAEQSYDFIYLIGGLGGAQDPIGNNRSKLDGIIGSATGSTSDGDLLVQWTGSIVAEAAASTTGGPVILTGPAAGAPSTQTSTFTIASAHRALYLVFSTDEAISSEEGLWPHGSGLVLDDVTVDGSPLYTDETAVGGVDAYAGNVIKGTVENPVISARVASGVGELWGLYSGSTLPTSDYCSPRKSLSSDLEFFGGNGATMHTIPGEAPSIVTCTLPIPSGTASVFAEWAEYVDLPRGSGFVQYTEYRFFMDSAWSTWRNASLGGTRRVGALRAWANVGSELAEASQADSVQLRYTIRCTRLLAADLANCQAIPIGLLYDDLRLEVRAGVPIPVIGIFPGSLAQTTFVDGTIGGDNCIAGTVAAGQCWPGVRGSDNGSASAVHDNFNSPLGDSIVIVAASGLRKNGMGINWRLGFDRSVSGGLSIARTNGAFNPAYDAPRVIYRLFDPATKTWSPFDSSDLDANSIAIASSDTIVTESKFRMNWPPRDKVAAGASLPGGFTIKGIAAYSGLSFLPRGTRLQYYFKAVDINGGRSYQFTSDAPALEVEDRPILPGSSIRAPDINEFNVLPGAYPAGPTGTLLAGNTTTPILNLDGAYTVWGSSLDPVTQALRALGVRADRYRLLQGLDEGANIGGHELPGQRPGRWANYFPNAMEYGIKDSLAAWYRIVIQSSHTRTSFPILDESDASLVRDWWDTVTGTDGGDRCMFFSGDDGLYTWLNPASGFAGAHQLALAQSVFGVASAADAWNGAAANPFPTIKDMFADPAAGPGLGSGSYSYILDGGCPGPNRFDALTKIVSAEAQNAATYPTFASVTNVAAVSYMTERDVLNDHDRNKALGYGFSIQFIRQGGMNLVDTRAQVLYKFLTSCRGPRTVSDTASCWPCPTDANKYSNWASSSSFAIGTYGPLYPIQDATRVLTPVEEPGSESPRFVNALSQNRPNPFNPSTTISYSLSTKGRVTIRIYGVGGRLVRTLVDAIQPAGFHLARWDGTLDLGGKAASGIYFYVIAYPDGNSSAKKMVMLR